MFCYGRLKDVCSDIYTNFQVNTCSHCVAFAKLLPLSFIRSLPTSPRFSHRHETTRRSSEITDPCLSASSMLNGSQDHLLSLHLLRCEDSSGTSAYQRKFFPYTVLDAYCTRYLHLFLAHRSFEILFDRTISPLNRLLGPSPLESFLHRAFTVTHSHARPVSSHRLYFSTSALGPKPETVVLQT